MNNLCSLFTLVARELIIFSCPIFVNKVLYFWLILSFIFNYVECFEMLCFLIISLKTSTDIWITITLMERAEFSAKNIPFSHYTLCSFKVFFIFWVVNVHGCQKCVLCFIIAIIAETHYPPASCAHIHYLVSIHVQNAPVHIDALNFFRLEEFNDLPVSFCQTNLCKSGAGLLSITK